MDGLTLFPSLRPGPETPPGLDALIELLFASSQYAALVQAGSHKPASHSIDKLSAELRFHYRYLGPCVPHPLLFANGCQRVNSLIADYGVGPGLVGLRFGNLLRLTASLAEAE